MNKRTGYFQIFLSVMTLMAGLTAGANGKNLANTARVRGMVTFLFFDAGRDALKIAPLFKKNGVAGVAGIRAVLPPKSSFVENALSWSDIRTLAEKYNWEIASNGYTFWNLYDTWIDAEREVMLSKKTIEDSTGLEVHTYISPTGTFTGLVDFLVRGLYRASVSQEEGFNTSSDKRFKLKKKALPRAEDDAEKIISQVADSGYWAIFRIDDPSKSRTVVEKLLLACRKYGVKIVKVSEGVSMLWGEKSPLEYGDSLSWLFSRGEIPDYSGEGSKFETWQNGSPLGWDIYTTADSVWPDTVKKGFGVDVKTPTHLRAHLTPGDTLTLTHFFAVPPMPCALFRLYISMWSCERMGNTYWTLKNLEKDLWWDNRNKVWTKEEIRNTFDEIIIGGLKPYSTYIYFPDSTSVALYIFSCDNIKRDMVFMYDDFTLMPTLTVDARLLERLADDGKEKVSFKDLSGPVIADNKGKLWKLTVKKGKFRTKHLFLHN